MRLLETTIPSRLGPCQATNATENSNRLPARLALSKGEREEGQMSQSQSATDSERVAASSPTPASDAGEPAASLRDRLHTLLEELRIPALILAAELAAFLLVFWITYVASRGWHELPPDIVGDVLIPGFIFVALANLIWVVILVHEAGHILAGWLVGFRFRCLFFGPVAIIRTRSGLRVRRSHSWRYAVVSCPVGVRSLVTRFVIFGLGGSLANLTLAVAAYMAVVSPQSRLSGVSLILFVALGFMSLWTGMVSLIPIRARGQDQDGKLILNALRRPRPLCRVLALQGLAYLRSSGVRPRHWPVSLVYQALLPEDATTQTGLAWLYAYAWFLDRGDVMSAGRYLDRVLSAEPAAEQVRAVAPLVPLEAAYFFARHRHDVATARTRLDSGTQSPFVAFMRPRAEAAILLAEGQPAEAQRAAEQGLAELDRLRSELEKLELDGDIEAEDLSALVAAAQQMAARSTA